ncbi:hypothetical protein [Aureimonas sp. SK2]|uniref:hypothetical protein n=1 Tax=Aureimonas sp. SK2 TaxID=3015992 RepID=UPI0024446203|nr:hypothetical protein [Aureimonas sp. SK2]
MFRTPHPAGPRAALALRLAEAALAPGGWTAVAGTLEAEFGLALRFEPEAADGRSGRPGDACCRLPVPGLGAWSVDPPAPGSAADPFALPLAEILGFATRLAEGLPLEAAEGQAALDPLPYATILLDGEARLLFANAAGEDLLRSRRLFLPTRPGTRLRAADRGADERLEEAIAGILEGDGAGSHWPMRRPDAGSHLAIRLRPIGPVRARPGAARLLLTLRAIGAASAMPAAADDSRRP